MNEIKIFSNKQFGEIRTAKNESGEPLFCLGDLCKALNLTNTTVVANRLDEEEVTKLDLGGRVGITNFVTESGMYSVILRSDSSIAKPMQKWVTSEVLPTIRKHGAYMTQSTIEKVLTDPDTLIQLAQTLKEERRQRELAQKQLEYQAPIVQYANEVLSSTSGHTATTIASELNMSAITLNKLLCKAHFQRKTGKKGEYSICANYQGKGYVVVSTHKYVRPDETVGSSIDIHYTELGRMKIHEITKRAISAGVLEQRKGRYFINNSWIPASKQS